MTKFRNAMMSEKRVSTPPVYGEVDGSVGNVGHSDHFLGETIPRQESVNCSSFKSASKCLTRVKQFHHTPLSVPSNLFTNFSHFDPDGPGTFVLTFNLSNIDRVGCCKFVQSLRTTYCKQSKLIENSNSSSETSEESHNSGTNKFMSCRIRYILGTWVEHEIN